MNPKNPFNQPVAWPVPPVPPAPPAPSPSADAAVDQRTGEVLGLTRDALLLNWQAAQKTAAEAVAHERTLRDQVVGVFGDPAKDKGTVNVPLGNGYKLKIVNDLNYTLKAKFEGAKAEDHNEAVRHALTKIIEQCENGAALAHALIRWKPELSVSAYNSATLPPLAKEILDDVIVTTPASAKVEIVAPKEDAE